jgi:hypothetical protein
VNRQRAQRWWDATMAGLIALAFVVLALAYLSPWIGEAWRALR